MEPEPTEDLSGGSLSVSGWGATLKANGVVIVLLLAISALAVITARGFDRLLTQATEARTQQLAEHRMILENQSNLACVLLMTDVEKSHFSGNPTQICDYLRLIRMGGR